MYFYLIYFLKLNESIKKIFSKRPKPISSIDAMIYFDSCLWEVWTLDFFIKNTRMCQLNYKTFSDVVTFRV